MRIREKVLLDMCCVWIIVCWLLFGWWQAGASTDRHVEVVRRITAERDTLATAVDAIRALHVCGSVLHRDDFPPPKAIVRRDACLHDYYEWPCPTIAALEDPHA